jgi:hypothetical protein
MKHDKLLDAIGQIGEDTVQEAEEAKLTRRETRGGKAAWKRVAGLAAAILLVAGIGLGLPQMSGGSSSTDTTADMAAPAEEEISEAASADTEESVETAGCDVAVAAPEDTTEAAPEDEANQSSTATADGETLLTQPPEVTISGTDLVLSTGNYEWTLTEGEEASTAIGCGTFVLDEEDTIATLSLQGEDTFSFQTEGQWTEATALCYPESGWSETDAESIPLTVTGNTVTLPDATQNWIVVLNLTWDGEGYSGNGEYHVYVIQGEE